MGLVIYLFLQSCVSADAPGAKWDEISAFTARMDAVQYQEQNQKEGCYSTIEEVLVNSKIQEEREEEAAPQ